MKKKILLCLFLGVLSINTYAESTIADNKAVLRKITPGKMKIVSGIIEAREGVQSIFTYSEDSMYTIYCRVNHLTTILLQPGEKVTFVGGGDTARWRRASATTGSTEGEREVIYIKPSSINLKTNLVINTNKRNYQIILISDKNLYNPSIKWQYPDDEMIEKIEMAKEKERLESIQEPLDPTELNYNYVLSTNKYDFTPKDVFNDKTKTYIVMKDNLQEMPTLYIVDGKNLLLVNYRTKGNFIIVDRLFDKAELKIGDKKIIIKKKD